MTKVTEMPTLRKPEQINPLLKDDLVLLSTNTCKSFTEILTDSGISFKDFNQCNEYTENKVADVCVAIKSGNYKIVIIPCHLKHQVIRTLNADN